MIYDITQPLFESQVYPGDPKPERRLTERESTKSRWKNSSARLLLRKQGETCMPGMRKKFCSGLHCAPLNLSGADGAPCRATLCGLQTGDSKTE